MSDTTAQRILDAAYSCVADVGLARLTLEDVARHAGVSRQTLYRHFASRDGLLRALVVREEERFIARIRAAAEGQASVHQAIAAGAAAALQAAAEHRLLQRLLREEPGEILPLFVLGEGPVIAVARPVVAEIIDERLELESDDLALAADVCTRLLVSHVLDPTGEPAAVVGERIARMVLHGVIDDRPGPV